MITDEFNENIHNGVKYYEYDGVYFYRDGNIFDDNKFMKLMQEYSQDFDERPIYVFRGRKSGELICKFDMRNDCKLKKQVNGVTIMYRESDIDFNDKTVLGFIKLCHLEQRNHNVVCFLDDGFGGYRTQCDLTLNDFFKDFCNQ